MKTVVRSQSPTPYSWQINLYLPLTPQHKLLVLIKQLCLTISGDPGSQCKWSDEGTPLSGGSRNGSSGWQWIWHNSRFTAAFWAVHQETDAAQISASILPWSMNSHTEAVEKTLIWISPVRRKTIKTATKRSRYAYFWGILNAFAKCNKLIISN